MTFADMLALGLFILTRMIVLIFEQSFFFSYSLYLFIVLVLVLIFIFFFYI